MNDKSTIVFSTCEWSEEENAFHKREEESNCRLAKTNNGVYHEFNNIKYSLSNAEGVPVLHQCPNLSLSVTLSTFDLNVNRCSVVSKQFGENRFTHVFNYIPNNEIEYWNFIRNVTWFWDNLINNSLNKISSMKIWPSYFTVTDMIINKTKANNIMFLRPVHFLTVPTEYYKSLRDIVTVLFNNALLNPDLNEEKIKRSNRSKIKCNRFYTDKESGEYKQIKCNISSGCASVIYKLFGKNNYVHVLCCALDEELNCQWYNFFQSVIEYRWRESYKCNINIVEQNENIIKCNSETGCGKNIKDVIKKHRLWTESIGLKVKTKNKRMK